MKNMKNIYISILITFLINVLLIIIVSVELSNDRVTIKELQIENKELTIQIKEIKDIPELIDQQLIVDSILELGKSHNSLLNVHDENVVIYNKQIKELETTVDRIIDYVNDNI